MALPNDGSFLSQFLKQQGDGPPSSSSAGGGAIASAPTHTASAASPAMNQYGAAAAATAYGGAYPGRRCPSLVVCVCVCVCDFFFCFRVTAVPLFFVLSPFFLRQYIPDCAVCCCVQTSCFGGVQLSLCVCVPRCVAL
jgi:hypothetical protein